MKKAYRHIISVGFLFGFIACTIFLFPHSLGRFIESSRDVITSIGYMFCRLLGIGWIDPTVINLPKYPYFDWISEPVPSSYIPTAFSEFLVQVKAFGYKFIDIENLANYLVFILKRSRGLSYFLLLAIPTLIYFKINFRKFLSEQNNNYNKTSWQLKLFLTIMRFTYIPVKNFIKDMYQFVRDKNGGIYLFFYVVIWCFNFNLITIVLEAFAYYIYFLVTFDVGSIYLQIYKLFLDISIPLSFLPSWVLIVIMFIIIKKLREHCAIRRLLKLENYNKNFLRMRALMIYICGTVNKGKTAVMTDMALTMESYMRDIAYKKLIENDLKYPNFTWINLENAIQKGMQNHTIYSLATCETFIQNHKKAWELNPIPKNIFDYDCIKHDYYFDDGLKIVDLWEVLETYTKLYFVFVIKSSLIISNYSIRSDSVMKYAGNFPRWDFDYLSRDSYIKGDASSFSHILDYDMLRLGRKIIKNNPNTYAYEFGILCATEYGKERLNNLELQGIKRNDDEVNQKNDLTDYMLKMIRHPSTIDYFPFVKFFTDEQRQTSLGANFRELMEVVHIRNVSKEKLALPFFFFEELIYSFLIGRFGEMYEEYRFNRSDNTLRMYLIKSIVSKYHQYYTRIYNKYSYKNVLVDVEDGAREGKYVADEYYLVSKKIYSNRYSTDCYSEFFRKRALKSQKGINDLKVYEGIRATAEELKEQNSFFERDMSKFD